MNLITRRLCLKPISVADIKKIHELHSLPETDEYNTLGIPKYLKETEQIVQKWLAQDDLIFKIELKEEKSFIGLVALKLGHAKYKKAEVWYKLDAKFWKNGYATEALKSVLDFGFNKLKLHRIEAGCAVENIGSIRVLEKVGMLREGRKRKVLPLKSGWSDNFEYAILETDFK
ncbi:GNAT family N-acetyltransferase [Zunongwangia sp. HRR-M8]|nr:GNAT family N-acetyltransferase [Zunongwangia sp. HRR-M8]WBL24015.1 GNAT family N-acetyltransferase [Zunongwangia sp. HRR-M8]